MARHRAVERKFEELRPASTILLRMERGRLPLAITLFCSATIAILTALRFVLMINLLSPSQYGVLNLLTTAVNLLPMVSILGIPLHLQRMVRTLGPRSISRGMKSGYIACALTLMPLAIGLFILISPFANSTRELIVYTVSMTIVCQCSGIAIFSSQLVLGAGYRGSASLIMLFSNSVLTLSLLIPYLFEIASLEAILLCWSAGCILVAIFVTIFAITLTGRTGPDDQLNAIMERGELELVPLFRSGILTIPSMVGPWLLVFIIRYMLGMSLGTTAVAAYAVASTIVDTAFLLASSIISFSGNRLLDRSQSPTIPFLWSGLVLTCLAIPATVVVPFILSEIGREGYVLSNSLVVLLYVSALCRLYITSWRQRSLAENALGFLSGLFIIVTLCVLLILIVWKPPSPVYYALIQSSSYFFVAVGQQLITSKRGKSSPKSTAPQGTVAERAT